MYNLMIVDDEEIARKGIARYLMKSFSNINNIFTAKDGNEAFSLYEAEKPDIIYTDIVMPRCDGLELVEKLHQNGYKPKVVIISAHENFDYAQNAIRLGVKDYILKPVSPEEIKEITKNLLKELNEQNSFLRNIDNLMNKRQKTLPDLRKNFLFSFMHRSWNETKILEEARLVEMDLTGSIYMSAILRISGDVVPKSMDGAVSSLCHFCQTAAGVLSSAHIRVYAIPFNDTDVVLLAITSEKESSQLFGEVNTFLNRMITSAEKFLGFSVIASFGGCYNYMEDLLKSYWEAAQVLNSTETMPQRSIYSYEDVPEKTNASVIVDPNLESKLLHAVKYQTYQNCLIIAEEIIEKINAHALLDCTPIMVYFLKLTAIMLRELQISGQGEGFFELDCKTILAAENPENCFMWFKNFLRHLVAAYEWLNSSKGNSIVTRAKHIMRDNMSDNTLSIDDVASKLYVSSNYLRYLFTQQSSESFVEYLTRIRMEYSIELLHNSNLKVQDIARQTGYSNQRYFSVCFKKYYGKTPSEIRA